MNSTELTHLTDWRFCRMDYAKKGPTYNNWQQTPLLLQDIPASGNIGVLTGPLSNGLLAIDFDGPWAWSYWDANIAIELPDTVTWTSGREARCQMAFTVPVEMWDFLKTFKAVEPNVEEGRKPDCLEFRWAGVQSVLPPSMHPDTKKEYEWVTSPLECAVAVLPLDLLEWMLAYVPIRKAAPTHDMPLMDLNNVTDDKIDECIKVLAQIKQHEPVLGYDDWIRVSWAAASHVGLDAARVILNDNWPEREHGEYTKLFRGFSIAKSPKFGSLVFRAASHNAPQEKKQIIKKAFGGKFTTRQISF